MEYEDAVEQVLAGVMRDLHNSSHQIHRLTQETQENTRSKEAVTVEENWRTLQIIIIVIVIITISEPDVLGKKFIILCIFLPLDIL